MMSWSSRAISERSLATASRSAWGRSRSHRLAPHPSPPPLPFDGPESRISNDDPDNPRGEQTREVKEPPHSAFEVMGQRVASDQKHRPDSIERQAQQGRAKGGVGTERVEGKAG